MPLFILRNRSISYFLASPTSHHPVLNWRVRANRQDTQNCRQPSCGCRCCHRLWSAKPREDSSSNPMKQLLPRHRLPPLPGVRTLPTEQRLQSTGPTGGGGELPAAPISTVCPAPQPCLLLLCLGSIVGTYDEYVWFCKKLPVFQCSYTMKLAFSKVIILISRFQSCSLLSGYA